MPERKGIGLFFKISKILSKISCEMRIMGIREKVVVKSEDHGKQFCGTDEEKK